MRTESHTFCVACSARLARGRLHRFGSARPEILVASSTGPAAGGGAPSTLCLFVIGRDAGVHADARLVATSTCDGINPWVHGQNASDTSVSGHGAIAAPRSNSSPALHPLIGPHHLRPGGAARRATRLADRQLTPPT